MIYYIIYLIIQIYFANIHLSQVIPDILQVIFHYFGVIQLTFTGSPRNQEFCLQFVTALLCPVVSHTDSILG